jgi:catechol 2,3-dioxygenase-like lactoylglutathione lyase family enzyme
MSVQVYGCNHVAIEVDDLVKAQAFYEDVVGLQLKARGEGQAFFQLGNHQFLAMTEVDQVRDKGGWHFGLLSGMSGNSRR